MARTQEKTTEILNKVLAEFQKAYKDAIEKSGHKASGNLGDTQSFEVEYAGGNWLITLNMQDYWKYLEFGTKPHFPPVDKILQWVKVKKLLPRDKKTGKFLPHKQAAFAICKKIAKYGTEGTHILEKTMNAFGFKNKVLRAIFQKHKANIDKTFALFYEDLNKVK